MKQYDFTAPENITLENVEKILLDQLSEMFSKIIEVTSVSKVEECYKNFVVKTDKGKELDCEISWNEKNNGWYLTVWEMEY